MASKPHLTSNQGPHRGDIQIDSRCLATPKRLYRVEGSVNNLGRGFERLADIACIDLFCGAGGLTRGLQNVGVNVVAGVDVDQACKHAFEVNNDAKFLLEDVSELSPEKLNDHFGDASISGTKLAPLGESSASGQFKMLT
ncbi:DNA cytosine methyltransferase [Sulfitobacter sp. JL08]|uniref:DNA cytosine methyltransferase n=1 Tax=Sulfitobacter sp. JL08 TaxID=2070369 RepID=UPI0020C7C4ED|nr:DNA cytosine methyltransferase [Sulfitobacter sp. JL08]